MIQRTTDPTAGSSTSGPPTNSLSWGSRHNGKLYTLEVVQHPIRARMCGFGDKDRRPLAPAAVATMNVYREDNTQVEVDDIDCSFFLVTVDLWSEDGKQEMNLVLHPNAAQDRGPPMPAKPRRPTNPPPPSNTHGSPPAPAIPFPSYGPPTPYYPPWSAPASDRSPSSASAVLPSISTSFGRAPGPSSATPYGPQYGPPSASSYGPPSASAYGPPSASAYGPPSASAYGPPSASTYGPPSASAYGPPSSTSYGPPSSSYASSYPSYHYGPPPPTFGNYGSTSNFDHSQPVNSSVDQETNSPVVTTTARDDEQREGEASTSATGNSRADPSAAPSNSPTASTIGRRESRGRRRRREEREGPDGGPDLREPIEPGSTKAREEEDARTGTEKGDPKDKSDAQRATYTRTLVGPLSSNATRLLDEHRKPGIFFLFQDLSVRTEGTFRLRLRLMNVGAPPAPEPGAAGVHTGVSPVLAQVFTKPFTVFSAKRFPGVPDTTALSIAFNQQNMKLPLRNRHGSGSKRRRRGAGGGSDDEESD
ncbi:velvet factor-domain-containing protein [Schizophyllum commune]